MFKGIMLSSLSLMCFVTSSHLRYSQAMWTSPDCFAHGDHSHSQLLSLRFIPGSCYWFLLHCTIYCSQLHPNSFKRLKMYLLSFSWQGSIAKGIWLPYRLSKEAVIYRNPCKNPLCCILPLRTCNLWVMSVSQVYLILIGTSPCSLSSNPTPPPTPDYSVYSFSNNFSQELYELLPYRTVISLMNQVQVARENKLWQLH